MSVLGLNPGYTVKYNPLPSGVPSGMPLGTPSDKGLYLTVYPSSRPNTDTIYNCHTVQLSNIDLSIFQSIWHIWSIHLTNILQSCLHWHVSMFKCLTVKVWNMFTCRAVQLSIIFCVYVQMWYSVAVKYSYFTVSYCP